MIVAYYYSDKMDCGVDAFVCTTEADGIRRLAGIMKECSATRPDFNRILDTAIEHAKLDETDEAIRKLMFGVTSVIFQCTKCKDLKNVRAFGNATGWIREIELLWDISTDSMSPK